jgi:hypothetical protein
MDIEEMIADAKAEEEVKNDMFSKYNIESVDNSKVTIDLSEYTMLKLMEMDFNRVLSAAFKSLRLSYDFKRVYIESDGVITDVIRALYPDECEEIRLNLIKEENIEDE